MKHIPTFEIDNWQVELSILDMSRCIISCHLIIEFIRRIFSERPKQTDVALQYNELIPVSKYIETVIGERVERITGNMGTGTERYFTVGIRNSGLV